MWPIFPETCLNYYFSYSLIQPVVSRWYPLLVYDVTTAVVEENLCCCSSSSNNPAHPLAQAAQQTHPITPTNPRDPPRAPAAALYPDSNNLVAQ